MNQSVETADELTRQTILDSFQKDPGLDASKIEVAVNNGEVILKGKADTEIEKLLAEKIARSVAGVTTVENHLHIEIGIMHALSSLAAHIQSDIIKDDEDDTDPKTER